MTMDETTQERIAKESVQSDVQNQNKSWEYRAGYRNGYIAGATADAAQTETLANVLDQIAQAPTPDNEREMISWIQTARHLCQTALEQWKGKEDEPVKETTTYNFSTEEKKKLLAKRIESRMKEAGLQRQEFADLMGVQPSTITKWLSGDHNFEINTLFEIERQLNISLFHI